MFFLFLIPALLFGDSWSEEALEQMSLEEKVGQLFMGPISPMGGEDHIRDWEKLLKECHIGNGIVKQGSPAMQIAVLNRLQMTAKWPLLISADYEWGLGMRIKEELSFPRNMTLGAIQTPGLIYELGREIGREARLVGVHINLAPVADVNNNPENPVIHMRSFGEDEQRVAECVKEYVQGIQSTGTLACAKHFPGHGDTRIDSHADLPILHHSRERLEQTELLPFRAAIEAGVAAVMTGHLLVPIWDPEFPASLSPTFIQRILREQLGFKGLIISDALNMKALLLPPEKIAVLARKAGCDLLLYGAHLPHETDELMRDRIPRAYQALLEAYRNQELEEGELNQTVLEILKAKERLKLHETRVVDLQERVASPAAVELKKRLFQEAMTEVGEPISLSTDKAAYVSINPGETDILAASFENIFPLSSQLDERTALELGDQLSRFDRIFVGIHKVDSKDPLYGFSSSLLEALRLLAPRAQGLFFTTPYVYRYLNFFPASIIGYEDDPMAQEAVLNILKGAEKPKGRLPTASVLSK